MVDVSAAEDPALRAVLERLLSPDPSRRTTAVMLQADPFFAAESWDEWGRLEIGTGQVYRSCRDEMLAVDATVLGVPQLHSVIEDIDGRMRVLSAELTEAQRNHRFSLFLYTTDGGKFYRVFNNVLRERNRRGAQFEAFRPFLWHLMDALKGLPDQKGTTAPFSFGLSGSCFHVHALLKISWT